ncbi:uncharacterized protein LOC110059747 [Orbicella faveolata]|uniref:uncharacterized protein LOC110059747 n=1 Tax=Orbicella faveolata TaxID=48498 RepID=UPI0009E1CBFA|nr:uncharacterized protein LOC110059747 [Orbicella faveolata]
MAAFREIFALFAVFLVSCPIPTSLTPSPGLISKNYAQIARQFGFPFPRLPNISFANVGKQCKETVEKLSTSPLAYSYLDAIGKPQSGLFIGNVGWLGSYSECTKSIVNAHYCLAYIKVPAVNITELLPIHWGICAPKQCSEEDVTNTLQDIFTGFNKEYNRTLAKSKVTIKMQELISKQIRNKEEHESMCEEQLPKILSVVCQSSVSLHRVS